MKDKLAEYLKEQIQRNIHSCNAYSKSDDRGLCLHKEVEPLKEMLKEYAELKALSGTPIVN